MKPRCSKQGCHALTLVEVLVVVFVLAVLAAMLLPRLAAAKRGGGPHCVNNLKQIDLAYRIWAGDNGDKYPMEISVTNGGTLGLADGRNAWINYFVMSNELSTPKVLVCPQDINRQPPATNFSSQLIGHISYFVGLDASEHDPQALLSGDDNFEIGGVPVKSGLLEISGNPPIAWTTARHNRRGNILLADGSVQTFSNSNLTNWLQQTGPATNRLAIP
jgi:prepilin-type processing-associated H-X9-DG protein/prepilin-type N-terminal cleavage/methylation domain-containing protein